jgi:hypothetical protein
MQIKSPLDGDYDRAVILFSQASSTTARINYLLSTMRLVVTLRA